MSKPSAGGLVRRSPRATPSLRSTSSTCASRSSAASSSSSPAGVVTSQVADNFTLTLEAHAHDLDPLPDIDVASDSCSCSTAPGGGGRSGSDELEPVSAGTTRRAAFWGYVRVAALAVRAAVLAATLAVVVAGDVALAVHLFPRRGTT